MKEFSMNSPAFIYHVRNVYFCRSRTVGEDLPHLLLYKAALKAHPFPPLPPFVAAQGFVIVAIPTVIAQSEPWQGLGLYRPGIN